ncbi:MAG: hypothetical protein ABJP45_16950 [Cyclobacteriaceae bacterium]
MKNLATIILGLFLVSPLLLTNCSSDSDVDPGVAPEIPPLSTLVMDFDFTVEDEGGRTATKANWGFSVFNVAFWNGAITLTFAIPVASFAESFNHTPTFDTDIQGWVWEYDHTVFGAEYQARLVGKLTTDAVEWDMFITSPGLFTDFNWYSGTSALDGLSGQWILNQDPTMVKPFIQVDWNRSLSGELADIKYENIAAENIGNGSSIFFQVDNVGDYDRLYEIFSSTKSNTTEIEWSSTNKNGRIKDFLLFDDEEYHCWDENQDDIDCPI